MYVHLCNFKKENKVAIFTFFKFFYYWFWHHMMMKNNFDDEEFLTQITLVESRSFSKFEAVEL